MSARRPGCLRVTRAARQAVRGLAAIEHENARINAAHLEAALPANGKTLDLMQRACESAAAIGENDRTAARCEHPVQLDEQLPEKTAKVHAAAMLDAKGRIRDDQIDRV